MKVSKNSLKHRRPHRQLLHRNRDELRDTATRAQGDQDTLEAQATDLAARVTSLRQAIEEKESAVDLTRKSAEKAENQLRSEESSVRDTRDHMRALDGKLSALSSREQNLRQSLRDRRVDLEEEREAALRLEGIIQLRRQELQSGSTAKEDSRRQGEQGAAG